MGSNTKSVAKQTGLKGNVSSAIRRTLQAIDHNGRDAYPVPVPVPVPGPRAQKCMSANQVPYGGMSSVVPVTIGYQGFSMI
eukprot:gene25752-11415_t